MTIADEYWNKFLKETGRTPEDRCAGDLCFEANGFVGDELVSLVLRKENCFFYTLGNLFNRSGTSANFWGTLSCF